MIVGVGGDGDGGDGGSTVGRGVGVDVVDVAGVTYVGCCLLWLFFVVGVYCLSASLAAADTAVASLFSPNPAGVKLLIR